MGEKTSDKATELPNSKRLNQEIETSYPQEPSDLGYPKSANTIHDEAEDWFLHLHHDAPMPNGLGSFETWYEADPQHAAAFAELEALDQFLPDLKQAFSGGSVANAAHSSNHPQVITFPEPVAKKTYNWVRLAALAAACFALVVIGYSQGVFYPHADFRTAVGEVQQVDLPDGSSAWLNTDTAIAVSYTDTKRSITLLQGEAEFKVVSNPSQPFSVLSEGGEAQALGTTYSVKDLGDAARVTVQEGRVAVSSPTSSTPTLLGAGDQVDFNDGGTLGEVVQGVNTNNDWVRGFVSLQNLAFEDAIAEIDRYRPGQIVLLAGTDALKPIYARLALEELDTGLEALVAAQNLQISHLTEYLLIIH